MFWETVTASYLAEPEQRHVLASLVRKSGSSYFQPGARMIIREDGFFRGSISAGCLEETIAAAAVECLQKGSHRILEIDTRPFFGCFGEISVLLEVLPDRSVADTFFEEIQTHLKQRLPFTVVTNYSDTEEQVLTKLGQTLPGEQVLIEQVNPRPRILVLGDWPDGQAVANISRIMDWDVMGYDISGPGFSIEDILSGIIPDRMTAAVVMGHNFARDVMCLRQLLKCPFGYIGMIGSRKRRQEVVNVLIEDDDQELIDTIEQLHCPAGLDLGGDGHESVALSVVAEIHAQLFQRNAGPLKNKKVPVHSKESPE